VPAAAGYAVPHVCPVRRGGVMEYLTDTVLCKALFVLAFVVGFAVGILVGPPGAGGDE